MSDLENLVHAAGHWPSPYELAKLKEVLRTSIAVDDDGIAVIYFDDFIEAMALIRDERIESKMLACFETEGKRAFRTRIFIAKQVGIGFLAAAVAFLGALAKLSTNLYVLTQATYGAEDVNAKLQSYATMFMVVAKSMRARYPVMTWFLLILAFLLRSAFAVFTSHCFLAFSKKRL